MSALPSVAPSLALSPSVVHHRLMEEPPLLTYRGGDVVIWQSQLRDKLRSLLGYDQMPAEKCPLDIRSLWVREHELGTIEKLVFTSELGADVPCYLCLPHEAQRPCPI